MTMPEFEPVAYYDGNKFYADEKAAICDCADLSSLKPVVYADQLQQAYAAGQAEIEGERAAALNYRQDAIDAQNELVAAREEIERLKAHQCQPVCVFHEGESRAALKEQLAQAQAREQSLRELVPKRIPNGFVSLGKNYAESEDKFNDPYNPMCKFKRKYLTECEEALSTPPDDSALREHDAKLVRLGAEYAFKQTGLNDGLTLTDEEILAVINTAKKV